MPVIGACTDVQSLLAQAPGTKPWIFNVLSRAFKATKGLNAPKGFRGTAVRLQFLSGMGLWSDLRAL